MLITTDNNCGNFHVEARHISNLKTIANMRIDKVSLDNHPNLLVFPHSFYEYGDKLGEKSIIELSEEQVTTKNVMGFVGVNDSELTIKSRFDMGSEDYFLHYMLQRVFKLNVFRLNHSTSNENIFNFLLYIFPYFLKKAIRQGLYKEYCSNDYNNPHPKGAIDIAKHLKSNLPFNGRISYRIRQYSYDNKITQLIRHTIEFIRKEKAGLQVINYDLETQDAIKQIVVATPRYNKRQRDFFISKNNRSLTHPYFSEYQPLQMICMQILRYEGLKYGKEREKVFGILFDGAWLWEEYLNTVLISYGFHHPENNKSKGALYLFTDNTHARYPDFWKESTILDAKYKHQIDRNDLNQIISYMYIKQAKMGGFVCPVEESKRRSLVQDLGTLNGYRGQVKTWFLPIPEEEGDYKSFQRSINQKEKELQRSIISKTPVE